MLDKKGTTSVLMEKCMWMTDVPASLPLFKVLESDPGQSIEHRALATERQQLQ